MELTASSLELLSALPSALGGSVTVRVVDRAGQVQLQAGTEPGSDVGRGALERPLGLDGWTATVRFDAFASATLRPFLDGFFTMLDAKERLEHDLDSIHASSLALLEEVSMVGDTLPTLATGESEERIAEMGLEALLVAANVDRALYVGRHRTTGTCELLVHLRLDESGRRSARAPCSATLLEGGDEGVVARALAKGGPVLWSAADAGGGRPTGLERLAQRDVLAVPVHYGSGDKQVMLGALVLIDKRVHAYAFEPGGGADEPRLGSQESKLASTIAAMLGAVLGTRQVAELNKELGMANEIQQQILPDRPARVAGFELAGRCTNTGDVGGDYFDFVPMADGRMLVVVADVSGHNLASGMLMVGARSTLRAIAGQRRHLGAVFDAMACALHADLTRTERFITAVGVALQPRSRVVELANAGHNDAMLYRAAAGVVERLPSTDTVLGFLPAPRHQVVRVEMQPGDVLLLYTDGVVEAADARGDMLGEDRLERRLAAAAAGSSEEVLQSVFALVGEFAERGAVADDVTAVVIKAGPDIDGGGSR